MGVPTDVLFLLLRPTVTAPSLLLSLKEYSDMIKNGYVKQDGCAVAEAGQSPAGRSSRTPGFDP
jgi:hypothetical protein